MEVADRQGMTKYDLRNWYETFSNRELRKSRVVNAENFIGYARLLIVANPMLKKQKSKVPLIENGVIMQNNNVCGLLHLSF
jgi:hypothetical protein